MNNYLKLLLYVLISVFIINCTSQKKEERTEVDNKSIKPVKVVYVDWSSEKASSNVVKAVIESKLKRECELLSVPLAAMWQSIAAGDQDITVAAWLPNLHSKHLNKYESDVVNLGPNLEGTRIGLVVPEYVSIDSIPELKNHSDKFNNKIIGIDPQAGIMGKTKEVIGKYNLNNFNLVSGSGSTMTTILSNAISEKRPVVVTGWTPHWMFAKWNLKYLKDPLVVFGKQEHISTVVRKGLKNDMSEIYNFMDNFYWKPEDMEQVMLWAQSDNMSYFDAANKWINNNKTTVQSWLKTTYSRE